MGQAELMASLSVAIRNAMLNALVATVGASPTIEVRTGGEPSLASGDTGTLLATFSLPVIWAGSAAEGSVEFEQTGDLVATTTAVASGTAGHFRMKSLGGTAHISGTVSTVDGGGDLILDTVSLIAAVPVSITSWFLHTQN